MGVKPDLAEIAARYGAEKTVPNWQARLVCRQCRSRHDGMAVIGRERPGLPSRSDTEGLQHQLSVTDFNRPSLDIFGDFVEILRRSLQDFCHLRLMGHSS